MLVHKNYFQEPIYRRYLQMASRQSGFSGWQATEKCFPLPPVPMTLPRTFYYVHSHSPSVQIPPFVPSVFPIPYPSFVSSHYMNTEFSSPESQSQGEDPHHYSDCAEERVLLDTKGFTDENQERAWRQFYEESRFDSLVTDDSQDRSVAVVGNNGLVRRGALPLPNEQGWNPFAPSHLSGTLKEVLEQIQCGGETEVETPSYAVTSEDSDLEFEGDEVAQFLMSTDFLDDLDKLLDSEELLAATEKPKATFEAEKPLAGMRAPRKARAKSVKEEKEKEQETDLNNVEERVQNICMGCARVLKYYPKMNICGPKCKKDEMNWRSVTRTPFLRADPKSQERYNLGCLYCRKSGHVMRECAAKKVFCKRCNCTGHAHPPVDVECTFSKMSHLLEKHSSGEYWVMKKQQ